MIYIIYIYTYLVFFSPSNLFQISKSVSMSGHLQRRGGAQPLGVTLQGGDPGE